MLDKDNYICCCFSCDWEGAYEETYETEGQVICPACNEPAIILDPYLCEKCEYKCSDSDRNKDGNCPECGGKMIDKNC